MCPPTSPRPVLTAGYWVWTIAGAGSEILFVGKGPQTARERAWREVVDSSRPPLAWPRQVHSKTIVSAREGCCGEADAVITDGKDLALSVATADCLPIVLESRRHLVAIHAGWRGLAAGIITAAIQDLGTQAVTAQAWIGPAIQVCCYQVGVEVAARVAAVSGPEVVRPGPVRPHLDLVEAARIQLANAGVTKVRALPVCTRCSSRWLWSYRRDGPDAGRNWTFTWRR